MDKIILAQKLESLRRCLQRVEDKCPAQTETLFDDQDLQDILVLNLSRAVQLCVDIASHIISQSSHTAPTTMGDTFTILGKMGILDQETVSSLKKAVGFRNIAVHNYEIINWEIVHNICRRQITNFQRFGKAVIQHYHL